MSLLCRLCGERIKFDDKHISERTGKRIPLDLDTEEPHDCPARKAAEFPATGNSSPSSQSQEQTQQKRYYQCNKGCGQEIYFDASNKSQSGKFIPLSKDTGLPHQCQ
jgi:hypothetical protein